MALFDNNTPNESKLDLALRLPEKLLGPVVGLTLFSMMVITFIDVIGRYVFNAPLPGGMEITEYLMASVIFLGLPLLSAEQGHVTVDLFDRFLSAKIKLLEAILVNILSFVLMSVLSWRLWLRAGETTEYGDVTAFLELPLGPLVYFTSIMVGITSLIMLLIVINTIGSSFNSSPQS